MNNPNAALNLTPFKRGHAHTSRRSRDVDRALREYRKLTPEAAKFVGKVLRDETEDTRLRLKAAEIIALHGMPKGDAAKRALEGLDGGVNSITVEFVSADGSVVTFEQAGLPPPQPAIAPAIIEVPFDDLGVTKEGANMDSRGDDDAT